MAEAHFRMRDLLGSGALIDDRTQEVTAEAVAFRRLLRFGDSCSNDRLFARLMRMKDGHERGEGEG
jgi:hypothetical protein